MIIKGDIVTTRKGKGIVIATYHEGGMNFLDVQLNDEILYVNILSCTKG